MVIDVCNLNLMINHCKLKTILSGEGLSGSAFTVYLYVYIIISLISIFIILLHIVSTAIIIITHFIINTYYTSGVVRYKQ